MSLSQAEANVSPTPTIEIVARCVAGESAAWRELHRSYYGVAWSFLARLGVPRTALDDATQEVFLQVFRKLAQFRGDADFRTWLFRVCLTQASRARRRARVKEMLLQLFSKSDEFDRLAAQRLPDSTEARIEAALARLSPGERAVFVLYELEGVPGKEVAALVGCTEASVWRRLHYARARFTTEINKGPLFGNAPKKAPSKGSP